MITNENNDVKVVDKDGNFKWIQKHIAMDSQIMKGQGLAIVQAPLMFKEDNVAEVKSAEKTNKTKK